MFDNFVAVFNQAYAYWPPYELFVLGASLSIAIYCLAMLLGNLIPLCKFVVRLIRKLFKRNP